MTSKIRFIGNLCCKITRFGLPHENRLFSWGVLALMLLSSCSSRIEISRDIAQSAGLTQGSVSTSSFDLLTYTRFDRQSPVLTVYLEGDGYAWITPTRLSDDPTPKNPIGLRLAAQDKSGNIAYIARPCQYGQLTSLRGCSSALWSNARFAPEVIAAASEAIRSLMRQSGTQRLRLVGYSGGGTLAVLIAENFTTQELLAPELLITVAGVLDTDEWTRIQDISPLVGSVNPADKVRSIASIPQVHFVGEHDTVVPPPISQSYLRRVASVPNKIHVIPIPDYTHDCCWTEQWPAYLHQAELLSDTR